MKFGHVNIATLLGHFTDIYILIERNMFDVFGVSETRLDDPISDEKICTANYFCHRKDRNREGGMVAVYVSSVIPHKRRRDLEENNIGMLCIELCPLKAKNILFAIFYKPPNFDNDMFIEKYSEFVKATSDETNKELVITGDFNADMLCKRRSKYARNLHQISQSYGLFQFIKEPTRVTTNSATIIDLIYVNAIHRFTTSGVSMFGGSDHNIIYAVKKAGQQKAKPRIKTTRTFKTYSKTEFVNDLNRIPWDTIRLFDDVNDAVFAWNKLFLDVVNKHRPLKQTTMKGSNKPWVTSAIRRMMKERDSLLRKAKKTVFS